MRDFSWDPFNKQKIEVPIWGKARKKTQVRGAYKQGKPQNRRRQQDPGAPAPEEQATMRKLRQLEEKARTLERSTDVGQAPSTSHSQRRHDPGRSDTSSRPATALPVTVPPLDMTAVPEFPYSYAKTAVIAGDAGLFGVANRSAGRQPPKRKDQLELGGLRPRTDSRSAHLRRGNGNGNAEAAAEAAGASWVGVRCRPVEQELEEMIAAEDARLNDLRHAITFWTKSNVLSEGKWHGPYENVEPQGPLLPGLADNPDMKKLFPTVPFRK